MNVLAVIGTRPEAIKLAPVILHAQQVSGLKVTVCLTGQHEGMLDQALLSFGIQANHNLKIMHKAQTLCQAASEVLCGLEAVIRVERPDWVLVQGDTTTVAAASMCAAYERVRLGHVEAGLRTYDRDQPFPEELNRRVAAVFADLHFAPTRQAFNNLLAEGVPVSAVVLTGNPVIDALHWMASSVEKAAKDAAKDESNKGPFILVTAHRRENIGKPLEDICSAVEQVLDRVPDIRVVWPVHPNPRVSEIVRRRLGKRARVSLTEPAEYRHFVSLLMSCELVLSDSGGVQEEAPAFGKPVLVLRGTTERPEGIEAGAAKLVGTDPVRVAEETIRLLSDREAYRLMANAVNPYGDGMASRRIVSALLAAK
jgi:UDP-N-acetylglucosamine 2-epimerase (non-hydrolysing)